MYLWCGAFLLPTDQWTDEQDVSRSWMLYFSYMASWFAPKRLEVFLNTWLGVWECWSAKVQKCKIPKSVKKSQLYKSENVVGHVGWFSQGNTPKVKQVSRAKLGPSLKVKARRGGSAINKNGQIEAIRKTFTEKEVLQPSVKSSSFLEKKHSC